MGNDNDWLRGDDNSDDFDWDNDKSPQQDDKHTGGTDQPAGDDDDFIPAWLKDAGESPSGADRDSQRTGVTGQLDWRKNDFEDRIEEAERAGGKTDIPDWLQGADDEQPRSSTAQDEDDIPDWLKGAGDEKPRSSAAQDEDVPDWLQGADKEQPQAQPEPDWMQSAPSFDDDDDEDVPDWLQGADEEQPQAQPEPDWMQSAPSFDDDDDEDVPDWLKGADEEQPQAQPEPDWMQSAPSFDDDDDEDVPDWLRGTGEKEPIQAGEETPSWLSSNIFTDDPTQVDQQSLVEDDDTALPPWLASMADDEEQAQPESDWAQTAPSFDDSDDDDVPDWLRSDEEDYDALFAAETQSPAAEEDFDLFAQLTVDADQETGLEDLLQASDDFDLLGALTEQPTSEGGDDFFNQLLTESQPEQPDTEVDDFFATLMEEPAQAEEDWLARIAPTQAEEEEVDDDFAAIWEEKEEQPISLTELKTGNNEVEEADDMAWLREIETGISEPTVAKSDIEIEDIDSLLASIETPDLSIAPPETGSVEFEDLFSDPAFASLDSEQEQDPEPQTPDWLSSVNVGEVSASSIVRSQKDRPIEDLSERLLILREEGLDLGSADDAVKEFEPATIQSQQISAPFRVTPDQQRHISLLTDMVGVSTTEEGEVQSAARRRIPIKLDRLLISLVVAVAVIAPFFIGAARIGNLPPGTFAANSPQQAIFNRIDTLQSGDLVLFAAEYGGTAAGELDDATTPLLRHILSRGARPVIVSSNPVGLLHVSNIMGEIGGTRNTDYYVGRYIVGDSIGIRAYIEDISTLTAIDMLGQPTNLNIDSLNDFALILVVVERSDSVRIWAEQVASITQTPLVVAASYSAFPLALPYMDNDGQQIAGLMVGYRDAYTYAEQLDTRLGGQLPITIQPASPTPTNPPTLTSTPEVIAPVDGTETVEATEAIETEVLTTPTTAAPTIAATDTPPVGLQATNTPAPTDTPTDRPTEIPTNTPTATPASSARFGRITANQAVNVRSGPGTSFPPVTSVPPGTRVEIIGENADGSWYNIRLSDGQEGWIADFLIELETNTGFIPGMYGWGVSIVVRQQQTPEATPIVSTDTGIPVTTSDYRDERWYGMTLGTLVIIVVIILANFIHLVRKLLSQR